MGDKFDPQLFFQHAENVGLYVPASEVFSLMKRSLDLPGAWAALVTGQAGDDTVIPVGASMDGVDVEDILFIRITANDITLELDALRSRDGFDFRADVQLRVRVIPERSELVSFRNSIQASKRVIQVKDIANHFEPVVRSSISTFVADHDAAHLDHENSRTTLAKLLHEALDQICFSAGLTLDQPPVVRFESSSLRQVQRVESDAARRYAEHQAAQSLRIALKHAQHEHLDHLSGLLTRLHELADASPNIELPELIRTFSENQRGELYQALFATDTTERHTQWIVVAAGDEMIFFDPNKLDTPARTIKINGSAGAVRSVQVFRDEHGKSFLLLGAATGVYRFPLDASTPDATWLVNHPLEVRGGFNSVTLMNDGIIATHSEIGIYHWPVNSPENGKLLFTSITQSANAIRLVQRDGNNLYCSVDQKILRWAWDGNSDEPSRSYTGSESTITALMVCSDGVFAGNSQGEVLHWSIGGDVAKPQIIHRGGKRAVESISLSLSQGVRRLIFTDTSMYVYAMVLGDTFTCHYEAGGQTLRRVEVAPDMLVATNELRDRLILWKPGQTENPASTIAVSRLCNRSVQDVCLVTLV